MAWMSFSGDVSSSGSALMMFTARTGWRAVLCGTILMSVVLNACRETSIVAVEPQAGAPLSMTVIPDTLTRPSGPPVSSAQVTTLIEFEVPEATFVRVALYDGAGELVTVLVNQYLNPGIYEVEYNASALASGLYFYQLTEGRFHQARRMLLIK